MTADLASPAVSSISAARLSGPTEPASEQVRRWIESPVEFWEACARDHGAVALLALGSLGPVALLSDPEHVREVFALPAERFEVRQYNEHYRHVMGESGVLLLDGEPHQRQRRILAPAFRPDQLLPAASVIRDVVDATAAGWPVDAPFNPRRDLHDVTFQVVLHLLFGTVGSPTAAALREAYREAVLPQLGSWAPWRNFTRLQSRIRALLAAEVDARRADPALPGLLTRLVHARDAAGAPLPVSQLEDHVFSMMIAGVDTAAVALSWALHWLSRAPAARARLVAELAAAGGAGADPEALRELPYLHAVYAETLRMYPVVPTPSGRRLTEETRIGEHRFPAGLTLLPCTYLVHRRASLYPDADRFLPERFLARRFARHEYFPYGGGVRACVGESLANLEFKVALATILGRWALQPTDDDPLRPVRHGTLLAPPDRLRVRVRPVEGPAAGAAA